MTGSASVPWIPLTARARRPSDVGLQVSDATAGVEPGSPAGSNTSGYTSSDASNKSTHQIKDLAVYTLMVNYLKAHKKEATVSLLLTETGLTEEDISAEAKELSSSSKWQLSSSPQSSASASLLRCLLDTSSEHAALEPTSSESSSVGLTRSRIQSEEQLCAEKKAEPSCRHDAFQNGNPKDQLCAEKKTEPSCRHDAVPNGNPPKDQPCAEKKSELSCRHDAFLHATPPKVLTAKIFGEEVITPAVPPVGVCVVPILPHERKEHTPAFTKGPFSPYNQGPRWQFDSKSQKLIASKPGKTMVEGHGQSSSSATKRRGRPSVLPPRPSSARTWSSQVRHFSPMLEDTSSWRPHGFPSLPFPCTAPSSLRNTPSNTPRSGSPMVEMYNSPWRTPTKALSPAPTFEMHNSSWRSPSRSMKDKLWRSPSRATSPSLEMYQRRLALLTERRDATLRELWSPSSLARMNPHANII